MESAQLRVGDLKARIASLKAKATELEKLSEARKRKEAEVGDQEEVAEEVTQEGEEDEVEVVEDVGFDTSAIMQFSRADPSAPFRKIAYFMRGPPGCGKSTAARVILSQHLKLQGVRWGSCAQDAFAPIARAFVLSTDDYFTHVDETGGAEYRFNPRKLREFHPKNQARCEVAMELGRTPLFVDNTNIALWEMRDYLKLAEKFEYQVEVVDPLALNGGALDPQVLQSRIGEGAQGRASGKAIPTNVLERMVGNFESLPEVSDPSGEAAADWLQAIRDSKSPFEGPPLPRYAGLDVEARALAALGAIDLGADFWGEEQVLEEGAPPNSTLFDARYKDDDEWRLPARLHVTAKFFGARPDPATLQAAEALVGTWHEVEARALVFVRGGGLLCADCAVLGENAEALQGLAGDGWLPHITMLTAKPWQAWESTSVLKAWKEASASSASTPGARSSGAVAVADGSGGVALSDSPNDDDGFVVVGEEDGAEGEVMEVDADGVEAEVVQGGDEVEVYPGLNVNGREVDVCVIHLRPPRSLGPCRFKLFTE